MTSEVLILIDSKIHNFSRSYQGVDSELNPQNFLERRSDGKFLGVIARWRKKINQ